MKHSKKIISTMLGAFAVLAASPFSYAATTDINATIPSSGDNFEGLVFIDPSIRPNVQPGQTVAFSETKGFYRNDPYANPTEKKQEVSWYHPNSSWVNDPLGYRSVVSFGLSTALFEDGSGRKGYFYNYNIDTLNSNNGYPLVSKADIPTWVSALGGNQTYIDVNLDESSYMEDSPFNDTWNVASLAQLANKSGAYLESYGTTSPTDPSASAASVNTGVDTVATSSTAWPTFKLFPTPAPTTSVTTDKPSYNAGDAVTITATSNDYTPFTGYHDEAVYVTGPNGYKKFLNITSGKNGTVQVGNETDTQFPYWGPNDTTVKPVYGGGSGDPKNPTVYNDTATLDTTGLAQGTYTAHFVMYDSIGRMSTSGTNGEVTAQFTVGPAQQKPTITFSPHSETVPSGQSVPVGYVTTGFQPGDTVKVTVSGNGKNEWSVSGDTKAEDFTSETENTSNAPVSVSYTATLYDSKGNQLAQDTSTIQWTSTLGSVYSPQNLSIKFMPVNTSTPFNSRLSMLRAEVTNEGPNTITTTVQFKMNNNYGVVVYDKKGNATTMDFPLSQVASVPITIGPKQIETVTIPTFSNATWDTWTKKWVQYKYADHSVTPAPQVPNIPPVTGGDTGPWTYAFDMGSRFIQHSSNGSSWVEPDRQYTAQIFATVDPDQSVPETTYSDNTATLILTPFLPKPPLQGPIKAHLGGTPTETFYPR